MIDTLLHGVLFAVGFLGGLWLLLFLIAYTATMRHRVWRFISGKRNAAQQADN